MPYKLILKYYLIQYPRNHCILTAVNFATDLHVGASLDSFLTLMPSFRYCLQPLNRAPH